MPSKPGEKQKYNPKYRQMKYRLEKERHEADAENRQPDAGSAGSTVEECSAVSSGNEQHDRTEQRKEVTYVILLIFSVWAGCLIASSVSLIEFR